MSIEGMNDGTLAVDRISPAGPQMARREQVEVSPMEALTRRIANGETFDILALERLFDLDQRVKAQTRKELFDAALAACQSEMPRVKKNGLIDYRTKDKPNAAQIPFARLEDLDACIRPVYQSHGFSVRYDAEADQGKMRVVAYFSCAGHTEKAEMTVSADAGQNRGPVQAAKASITQVRRHLLEMFFNVITEGADEDQHKDEPTITQAQADSLRDALAEVGGNVGAFLKAYGNLTRIEDMKASLLNKAWDQINAKKGRK